MPDLVTTSSNQLNTALLFLIFNRPDTTARVFAEIRKAKPARLYVAADGPRNGIGGEVERVAKARSVATAVDWPCELRTLFRNKNLGCKHAVSEAITWFFDQEEEGIILEDDCLPHEDFFRFSETLLDRYREDRRVSVITGNNFQNGVRRGDGSYYFSRYNHCWGWASWRRTWRYYQGDLPFWPEWRRSRSWVHQLPDRHERIYWRRIFDRVYAGKIDSWAYPWTASVWFHAGLTVTPNVNIVSNIGFGAEATHTVSSDDALAGLPVHPLGEIRHPTRVEHDLIADRYTFDYAFGGRYRRFPWPILRFPFRVGRYLYRRLRNNFV